MPENLALFGLGLFISLLGIINIKGDIRTIHWYNRWRVSREDAPKYGRLIGAGTLSIGSSLALAALLQWFFPQRALLFIPVAGIAIGLALMLYGQLKYNKGIF